MLVLLLVTSAIAAPVVEDTQSLTGLNRSRRGAPDVSTKRFNKNQPIGFVFDSSIPESARKTIRATTNTIAANTCLSFNENSGKGTQLNFIRGNSCSSSVGENPDSKGLQSIWLDQNCERVPTSITHEIFHSLGIHHTVTRKDRDLFVTVHNDRIMKGKEVNFYKLSDSANNNFGVPYEYGSIMHYGTQTFATVPGQTVIEPKFEFYDDIIGQRNEVTYNDYRLVNALYNCSSHCPKQMACQNGGYTSPKNCKACVCPEFYSGTNCQTPKNLISLTTSTPKGQTTFQQKFNSSTIGSYKREWYGRDGPKVIRAPEGRRIRVTLTKMSIQQGRIKRGDCGLIDIEIRDTAGGDLTSLGKHFCNPEKLEGYSFVSLSNVIGYKAATSPGFAMDIAVNYVLV